MGEVEKIACRRCDAAYRPGVDVDPCLGELPGVQYACCGHGDPHQSYIVFDSGVVVRGMNSIEISHQRAEAEGKTERIVVDNGRRDHAKARWRMWSGPDSNPDHDTWGIAVVDNV